MVPDGNDQNTEIKSDAHTGSKGPMLSLDRGVPMRLGANGDLQLESPRGWISVDRFGALVLELFAAPRPYEEVLQVLSGRATGQAELVEMLAVIQELRKNGVLVGDEDGSALEEIGPRSFGASSHVAMLDDTHRTERFLEAIRSVVRPGDTVLDLGAGTGVLSFEAAKAGAAKVFAVEVSEDVRMIRELCSEYVAAGTVEVIQGWSTSTTLPTAADVLICEIIGNDPFDEKILELTQDARRRLLKADARIIPGRFIVKALPVTIPEELIARHRFSDATVAEWARRWGAEFERLAGIDRGAWQCFYLRPQEARDWQVLAEPVILVDIELARAGSSPPEVSTSTEAVAGGIVNGVVIFFELDLGGDVSLSTHPAEASPTNHWRSPVWCVVDGREVAPGDRITISYRRVGGRSELDCE
jgi:16S rRNA G966 N2-methylase RsmD